MDGLGPKHLIAGVDTNEGGNANASSTTEKPAEPQGVPEALKRFEVDGKLSTDKLAESYLNLEKEFHKRSQENAALARSYEVLANKLVNTTEPTMTTEEASQKIVEDPASFVRGVAEQVAEKHAQPLGAMLLGMIHTELSNPEFVSGFKEYASTLPADIRASLTTIEGMDWAINSYKRGLKMSEETKTKVETTKLPHTESPSPSGGGAPKGKIYTRKEIREIMADKKKYTSDVADDISKAYDEGRVVS